MHTDGLVQRRRLVGQLAYLNHKVSHSEQEMRMSYASAGMTVMKDWGSWVSHPWMGRVMVKGIWVRN